MQSVVFGTEPVADLCNLPGVGLRASAKLGDSASGISINGSLAWRHAFVDTPSQIQNQFNGGATFAIHGASPARDAVLADVGLSFDVSERANLSLHYSGVFGDGLTDHGGKGTLKVKF